MATSKDPALRLLVVGKTGQGKSSTCNAIIGHDKFKASASSTSTTETCSWHKEENRFGMTIEVVDTPGFYDTDHSNSKVCNELIKSLLLSAPGFHAIAFVLMKGKFTPEMQNTVDIFFNWFGPGVEGFSFVILTDTDSKTDLEKFLQDKPHPKLTELIRQFENRVVPLQSRTFDEELTLEQVQGILQMAKYIKAMNNNECFSNTMYTHAEKFAEERTIDPSLRDIIVSDPIETGCKTGNRTSKCNTISKSEAVTDNCAGTTHGRKGNVNIYDNSTMRLLNVTGTTFETTKELKCRTTSSNEYIDTNQSNTRKFDDIRNKKSKPSSRAGRKIDPNSVTVTPSSAKQAFSYSRETGQTLNTDRSSTSVCADSGTLDSIELMKKRVNDDEDDQETNEFIAFLKTLIPSKCDIL